MNDLIKNGIRKKNFIYHLFKREILPAKKDIFGYNVNAGTMRHLAESIFSVIESCEEIIIAEATIDNIESRCRIWGCLNSDVLSEYELGLANKAIHDSLSCGVQFDIFADARLFNKISQIKKGEIR